jgi:hypothetical protein
MPDKDENIAASEVEYAGRISSPPYVTGSVLDDGAHKPVPARFPDIVVAGKY